MCSWAQVRGLIGTCVSTVNEIRSYVNDLPFCVLSDPSPDGNLATELPQ